MTTDAEDVTNLVSVLDNNTGITSNLPLNLSGENGSMPSSYEENRGNDSTTSTSGQLLVLTCLILGSAITATGALFLTTHYCNPKIH